MSSEKGRVRGVPGAAFRRLRGVQGHEQRRRVVAVGEKFRREVHWEGGGAAAAASTAAVAAVAAGGVYRMKENIGSIGGVAGESGREVEGEGEGGVVLQLLLPPHLLHVQLQHQALVTECHRGHGTGGGVACLVLPKWTRSILLLS